MSVSKLEGPGGSFGWTQRIIAGIVHYKYDTTLHVQLWIQLLLTSHSSSILFPALQFRDQIYQFISHSQLSAVLQHAKTTFTHTRTLWFGCNRTDVTAAATSGFAVTPIIAAVDRALAGMCGNTNAAVSKSCLEICARNLLSFPSQFLTVLFLICYDRLILLQQ